MILKILRIVGKDLKILLSDKKALAIMILMPVILTSILSSALKGVFVNHTERDKIHIAVVKKYSLDQEYGEFLRTLNEGLMIQGMADESLEELKKGASELDIEKLFFNEFLGSREIERILDYRLLDEDSAMEDLRNQNIAAVVVLPEGFIYDMNINILTPFRNKVEIRVIDHPEQQINGQIVRSIVEGFSDTMSSMIIGKNVLIESAIGQDLGDQVIENLRTLVEKINEDLKKIQVDVETLRVAGKKTVTSFDYYGAAMMTMFLLFAAGHGGRLLLEEKQHITFQRMVIAGIPKLYILAGKFLAIFLLALLQITVMIGFSGIVLQVHWGNLLLVALNSLCSAISIAGAGVLIAAATFRAGNDRMANVFESVVIQTMALLGGSFFPVELLPSFMQRLSIFSLNGIALKAYLKVMMGYNFTEIKYYLFLLLAVGMVLTILAVGIFGMEGRGKKCSVS